MLLKYIELKGVLNNMRPIAKATESKLNKWGYIKLKSLSGTKQNKNKRMG